MKKIVTILAVFVAQVALAQGIQLGHPSYGGSGCPSGSASITVSPANDAITILFDQFIAEAGNATGRRTDRKSCNLTIPVSVPNGYSVAIFQVDYRGYNLIPRGGMNRFDAEYFWAGAQGPRISRTFFGPLNDNFSVRDELLARNLVWTPCGVSVNLRVNASMMTQTNSNFAQSMGVVDSADVSAGLVYHIQYRRCW